MNQIFHLMPITISSPAPQIQSSANFLTGICLNHGYYYPQLVRKLKKLGICCPVIASALLQKLNYWTDQKCGHQTADSRRWIYNTYEEWGQQLGVSKQTIGRCVRSLARHGLLFKECFARLRHQIIDKLSDIWHSYRTTSWLSIDVGAIHNLLQESLEPALGAEVLNGISHNSKQNNAKLKTELSSIYINNSISTHGEERDKEIEVILDPWKESEAIKEEIPQHYSPPLEDKSQIQPINKPLCKDKPPQSSTIPNYRNYKQDRDPYPWEVSPGKPIEPFRLWRAKMYESNPNPSIAHDALTKAWTEFYNDPFRTTHNLFSQYLEHENRMVENCRARQEAGSEVILSERYARSLPEPTKENLQILKSNLQQLKADGEVRVAVVNEGVTSSSVSIALQDVEDKKQLKPFKGFAKIEEERIDAPSDRAMELINEAFNAGKMVKVRSFVKRFENYVTLVEYGVNCKI